MGITVEQIMHLLVISSYSYNIEISALGTTFCFDDDTIPDEVRGLFVKSIENPEFRENKPLRLNVYHGGFNNFSVFKDIYKDYIVK